MMQFPSGVNPRYGYFGAAIIAYYAFVGFKTSANVAEESQEPYKRFLAAPFGALCVAGVWCVCWWGLRPESRYPPINGKSTSPLLAVVAASALKFPPCLFSLIALIAVANGTMLTMFMASRVTFGTAEQRLLPSVPARMLPKRGTPWLAIAVTLP